ncbi:MAG: hypothetical protein HOH43_23615 [Candidatus Latescibacteria bacterium]|nr:hypothetical protein [Candidatus Latescibacterota bacterium]
MGDDRFVELLGCLLDGELSEDELSELALLAKDDPGRQQEIQVQLEGEELIALSKDDLRDSTLFLSALQNRISHDTSGSPIGTRLSFTRRGGWRNVLIPSMVSAAAIALIISVFIFWSPGDHNNVAQLVQAEGLLRWTGDGGRIDETLDVGRPLSGGTLELLAPDAGATLRFADQTSVTISGLAMLTLSEYSQKVLHLRYGVLSANVSMQPEQEAMVLHTVNAELLIEGTQFSVVADPSLTRLTVHEGRVRIKRLSDGEEAEIGAAQQSIVRIDDQDPLRVVALGESKYSWRANLADDVAAGWSQEDALSAYGTQVRNAVGQGEMTDADARDSYMQFVLQLKAEARLGAVPMQTQSRTGGLSGDRGGVSYMIAFSVPRGNDAVPVILAENSHFRIQGRVQTPADVEFGFAVLDADGKAGGKYRTIQSIDSDFDLVLPASIFEMLDNQGIQSASGRTLVTWWCSANDRDIGLEITGVALDRP